MFAAYSRNTEAGARRIAAQRVQALPPPVVAPEPPCAPVGLPVAEETPPENVVVPIRTPFAETRRIMDLVARMHGATYAEVVGRSRNYVIRHARQAAMCAVQELAKNHGAEKSLPDIGRIFGGRDHTTILSAMRRRGYR